MRRLCLFIKSLSTEQLSYIHSLLPQMRNSHRQPYNFNVFPCRTEYLNFSYVINEPNQLDPNIRTSSNYIFRNALLKFIRLVERKIFNINDSLGIKMLTRIRSGFSH